MSFWMGRPGVNGRRRLYSVSFPISFIFILLAILAAWLVPLILRRR